VSVNIFKTAVLHHGKGNFSKAKEIYETLLLKNPNDLAVLQNYGTLLSQTKEFKKAEDVFKKCLEIKPDDPVILYNYGKLFHDQKIFEKAIKFYEKSFEINPKNNFSMYNVGNIYSLQGKFEKAIFAFKKSIKINSENFLAHNNLALAFKNNGNFNDALKSYKNALEKNKNYVDGHVNYSTQLLMLEKFEEGFEEYEWRKKSKSFSGYINYSKLNLTSKVWNGENLDNKKLFVIAEQGIGDLIQFTRYLYFLKKKYKVEIILYVKSKKFSHFFNKKKFNIISEGDTIPSHDYHNHLLSLLKVFLKNDNLFCKSVNFFQNNKDLEEKWKLKINKYKGPKIGINSSTSLSAKDIPMKYFLQLASNFDFNFIVLQKSINKIELKEISNRKNLIYFPDIDNSDKAFIDSIEIIKNLDLIITADTSIAHVSATLEKSTWIPLPFISDWRWFLDEKSSRWYDNVALYRSKKIDNWDIPFQNIEKDLKKFF
tara:strand:- start:149 stop:1600 length:1452 start_codon:yes stop_codon:yes gene_type:complete